MTGVIEIKIRKVDAVAIKKVHDDIGRLLDVIEGFSEPDEFDVRHFLYHGELELALHLLVATALKNRIPVTKTDLEEIDRLATIVSMANREWLSELTISDEKMPS